MTTSDQYPSYKGCVTQVLSNSTQPLSIEMLIDNVGRLRPVSKGARSAIYRAIGQVFQAVPVSSGYYGWLPNMLTHNIFRHPLADEEAKRGFLMLDELEHAIFFPKFFETFQVEEHDPIQIDLLGGPTIRAEAYIERKIWSLRLGDAFVKWIDEQGGQKNDDIIVMVNDAVKGHYTLRLQPREVREDEVIQNNNIRLALLAEELIAEDRRERDAMPVWELAARLIARGFYMDSVPADDLHQALHYYSLLHFEKGIGYSLRMLKKEYRTQIDKSTRESYLNNPNKAFATEFIEGLEEQLDEQFDASDFDFESGLNANFEPSFGASGAVNASQPPAKNRDKSSNWVQEFEPFTDDSLFNTIDGLDLDGLEWTKGEEKDTCEGYESYLVCFENSGEYGNPLSHSDFHLLEVELINLVNMEMEFGYLLDEQQMRKNEL
ncbi:MAG: hypothetical protein AAF639_01460, partial [Chloroflexota bacterium]